MAQQRPGVQTEAGTDTGLRKAAAELLASRLRPCCLVVRRIGHAHSRSVDNDDTPIFPAAMAAPLLQLFGRVLQDALQSTPAQLASRLTVRRGGCGRHGHGTRSCKYLNFPDHFLAATVGVENLGEKSPEGVLFAEYP